MESNRRVLIYKILNFGHILLDCIFKSDTSGDNVTAFMEQSHNVSLHVVCSNLAGLCKLRIIHLV